MWPLPGIWFQGSRVDQEAESQWGSQGFQMIVGALRAVGLWGPDPFSQPM